MWTDDHEPPRPPPRGQPGQTVEYSRTMFVPMYPYVGAAKVIVGLYDTSTNERLKLGNTDRGDRSYQVGALRAVAADGKRLPDLQGRLASGGGRAGKSGGRVEVDAKGSDGRLPQSQARRDVHPADGQPEPRGRRGERSGAATRRSDRSRRSRSCADDAPVRKFALTAAQLGSRRHGGDQARRESNVRAGTRGRGRRAATRANSASGYSTRSSNRARDNHRADGLRDRDVTTVTSTRDLEVEMIRHVPKGFSSAF